MPESREIVTGYRLIRFENGFSRLRVHLYTGRTHQIRAHMAYLSHPILGDDVYGDRHLNRAMKDTALKLCAVSLTFHELPGPLSYLNDRTFTVKAPF